MALPFPKPKPADDPGSARTAPVSVSQLTAKIKGTLAGADRGREIA